MKHSSILPHVAFTAVLAASAAPAFAGPFNSNNVALRAWLPLNAFAPPIPANGAACWGYVSPSGREYALMGLENQLAVVEITNPSQPVIVGQVFHTPSLWCEMKEYGGYAYVSNEEAGGIDVINLTNVDNGVVTLAMHLTVGGLDTTHTVTVDPVSGFLYLNGSNLGGGRLAAYNLANPAAPTFAGQVNSVNGAYTHDSQVVTYTSGPYAGRQIAFACNASIGLDIYDVTNKANMFRMSRTPYPDLSYAHQGWLDDTRQFFYLNDELDSINRTTIFDVSNLTVPVVVGSYNSGVTAADHNEFWHNGFIFEAEYHAGVRIFCADEPLNPVQVGWFDTYPENDGSGFDGAWHVYPFFPSGTMIAADRNRGLFILDPSAALNSGSVEFSYPSGQPETINPFGGTTVDVGTATSCGATPDASTALLHYNTGSGFQTVPMSDQGGGLFEGTFPAAACGTTVDWYVSLETTGGATFNDPTNAPTSTYSALAATGATVLVQDNFETNQGWTTEIIGATAGQWQRGVPINNPNWLYDPAADGDGSGQCWLTENLNNPAYPDPNNTDVDGGAVRLTSPVLDMSGGNISIGYDYYLFLTDPESTDALLVEISSNGLAGPWTVIGDHRTDNGLAWVHNEITQGALEDLGVTFTANMRVRYTANDGEPQSIVESGVDGFTISQLQCGTCPSDLDGDGQVGINDLLDLLAAWGAPYTINDLLDLLAAWGPC